MPDLKLVQLIGVLSWFALSIASWIFFNRQLKDTLLAVTATVLLATLPVVIYLTPAISNEFFSGVMIMVTLIYYLLCFLPSLTSFVNSKKRFILSPKTQCILGILVGLCMLSKATAILLPLVFVFDRTVSNRFNIRLIMRQLLLVGLTSFLIAGWFYIRNIVIYGNPLYSTADYIPLSSYAQTIVPRDVKFFTTLEGFFSFDLFHSQDYSFLSGTFFSWFYDGHTVLIPPQTLPKLGVALVILALPIFFFALWGVVQQTPKIFTPKNTTARVFLFYLILLVIGYIAYNFKLPFYSTVKGPFLVSAVLPVIYFWAVGIRRLPSQIQKLVPFAVILYVCIMLKHFWILAWWYKL